jgi:mersacidin/lichenicidin family type 2 lantibiotic
MDCHTLVRAWRDPVFRASLPVGILQELPRHPAGDLTDDETDWSVQLGSITLGAGCGSVGCTRVVCTDPCATFGPKCNPTANVCTDAPLC